MIKRILVPYDGSASSRSALSIGLSIARITRAELRGLYVEDMDRFTRLSLVTAITENLTGQPITREPLQAEAAAEEEAAVAAELQLLTEEFKSECRGAGVEMNFRAVRGSPSEVITAAARSVDLVVMGNRGRHVGIDEKGSGATVSAILAQTTRPLLVVPDEPLGVSTIVVAYDGGAASERVLRAAAELASYMELDEIHLITVAPSKDEAIAIQAPAFDYLQAYELHVKPVTLDGKPYEAITRYARSVDASVIALGAFGSNSILRRLFGSTAQHLIGETESAVLFVS